jgi:hypothetical protein
MILTLERLTKLLDIGDPEIKKLKNQVIKSFGDPVAMRMVLRQQCDKLGTSKCYSCEIEAECSVIGGIAHLDLGEIDSAIQKLEDANQHFRGENETWNSIICMALLGLAFEKHGEQRQALGEFQQALQKLSRNYLRVHANDYPAEAIRLVDDLQAKISRKVPAKKKSSLRTQALLVFSSLPVYSGVQAGPGGPTWAQPLPKSPRTSVDQIILDDKLYSLHAITSGNQISLTAGKKYGLVKVFGDSMTASKPVKILEGDYVMFYESADAENGEIVIAACPENAGAGFMFIVKRYSKVDGHLISETTPPNKYNHILIDENTRIIGTVIAVAKPVQ